jgi:hypothetical protein
MCFSPTSIKEACIGLSMLQVNARSVFPFIGNFSDKGELIGIYVSYLRISRDNPAYIPQKNYPFFHKLILPDLKTLREKN